MRALRARALRELPGRVPAAARPRCGRTSPRSTPSPAWPTTSPTRATGRPRSGWRCSTRGATAARECRDARAGRDFGSRETAAHLRRARRYDPQLRALPLSLFEDLLSAFRQDVTTRRYAVLGRRARLLPAVGEPGRPARAAHRGLPRRGARRGVPTPLCTALQLTNFWQDLERDWRKGRLYLPLDDAAERAGARLGDLDAGRHDAGVARGAAAGGRRDGGAVRRGAPRVRRRVAGRLGVELRLTWLGGRRILERLERDRLRRVPPAADAGRGGRAGAPGAAGGTGGAR